MRNLSEQKMKTKITSLLSIHIHFFAIDIIIKNIMKRILYDEIQMLNFQLPSFGLSACYDYFCAQYCVVFQSDLNELCTYNVV